MSAFAVTPRVAALIARALDPGATEEEQRTSAHIAVRLIREYALLAPSEPRVVYRDRIIYRDRDPQTPRRRVIAARFTGRCQACGVGHDVGASVAWARDAGVVCLACHREARAA